MESRDIRKHTDQVRRTLREMREQSGTYRREEDQVETFKGTEGSTLVNEEVGRKIF